MATHTRNDTARALDLVALTIDRPTEGLVRGSVGTVLEMLDEQTVLVEFGDDQGCPHVTVMCSTADLLVLHYVPEAA